MIAQSEGQQVQVPHRRADELIAALTDRLDGHFGVSSVFGEPVERDGVTVIPVATVRVGFGGGTGSDPAKQQEGEGAGLGGAITAAGYIEIKHGRSKFIPVVRPERMAALAIVALLVLARARSMASSRTRRRLPFTT